MIIHSLPHIWQFSLRFFNKALRIPWEATVLPWSSGTLQWLHSSQHSWWTNRSKIPASWTAFRLVVDLPLWKIWKSVGMTIPNIWKKKHVPNHQPVLYWLVGIPRSCILIIPNIWRVVYSPNSSSTSVLNTAHFCDSLGRDRRCLEKSCWVSSKREMPWFSIRIIVLVLDVSSPFQHLTNQWISINHIQTHLVGRWLTILKNMKVNGKDYLI